MELATKTRRPEASHEGFSEALVQDLRYAVRTFSKAPGFFIVATLTLAVGIGATTAVFSVVNAVLLRPVHAPSPESIVRFLVTTGAPTSVVGVPELDAWRRAPGFEHVSAHRLEYVNFLSSADPQQIAIARVTRDFFSLFEATMAAGRTFTPEEDRVGGPHVAVLSHEFWQANFSGNVASAPGQFVTIGNTSHVIVGVAAAGFDTEQFDPPPAVWVPFQIDSNRIDAGNLFTVTGRLRAGVGIDEANASLAVALAAYRRQRPGTSVRTTWSVEPLRDAMVGNIRPFLAVLLGAVMLLLLIACANVANLSLARADVRAHEMAIRSALGASRRRIVTQVFSESLLLAGIGGGLGLLVGVYGVRALLAIYPSVNPYRLGVVDEGIPRIGSAAAAVTLDWRVFVVSVGTCVSTAILVGLWPGVMLGRVDAVVAMKSRAGGDGVRRTRRRAMLVVAEVALALMLVVGAMLLIRSAMVLYAVDAGFDPFNVITTRTAVASTRFETSNGLSELTRRGLERLRSIPGVTAVSATCCMPLETVWQLPFVVEGRPPESLTRSGRLAYTGFGGWTFIAPGYFDVLRVPILRGRDFTEADRPGAPGVVLINEEMARRFWPSGDPIGDRLIVGKGMRPEYDDEPVRQIVGIVGNVRDAGLTRPARPAMYVPIAQEPDGVTRLNVQLLPLVWMVRTAGSRVELRHSIERTVTEVSGLASARTRSMEEVRTESTARAQFNAWLMSIFGACALLLAAIGIYGLMAHSVQQRSREIGIRMALGADVADVRRLVLVDGLTVTAIGVALGLIGAFGLARFLSAMLFHVSSHDTLVFLTVPFILCATALIGILIPSRKAMRINPIDALRVE